MKKNLPVTQVEHTYPPEERLISETDLRGIVTTANDSFCKVAGFTQAELVGQSHNVVRHPEMPQEAFADLWRTLKAGERWVGVIKNRCKNGDYYWVKAFVSPVLQDSKTVGYRSVRKRPTREEVQAAEQLYKRMAAGEKGLLDTLAANRRQASLGERLGITGQLALLAGFPTLLAIGLLGGAQAGAPAALLWVAAGAGALVTAGLARLVYGWLTHPLDDLARTVSAFERGDLGARMAVYGNSRYSDIARVMNRALDGVEVALADMGQVLGSLARGEFGRRIVATLPGELGRIKSAANRAADQIETTVDALNTQLAVLAEGQLDVHKGAGEAEGKFREAQENAAIAATRLASLLRETVASSRAMAMGDLTKPIRTEASGQLADLSSHFNSALASLSETVVNVRTNARYVAQSTGELTGAIEEIASGASDQMITVERVTSSVQASSRTVAELAASTVTAAAKSQETVETVGVGRAKMDRMVEVVKSIAASSGQISQITGVIEGIANKTNLLALNAAIEAARAGEHGRGFAVVAAEVGTLAVGSAKSAQEIAQLVRKAVEETGLATESVTAVSADMDRIEATARESSELLSRIAASMEEQRATLADIGENAHNLSLIAQSNAASTEELAASASELARLADATYREADHFKTEAAR
ncbi:MAG TPA: methyl-accepting chemotaxis protein [Symbiobacteriaceae bacterium]|nr:methyl-accepting chemotaxis protein [Symbiobacteriaceae bacterium]